MHRKRRDYGRLRLIRMIRVDPFNVVGGASPSGFHDRWRQPVRLLAIGGARNPSVNYY